MSSEQASFLIRFDKNIVEQGSSMSKKKIFLCIILLSIGRVRAEIYDNRFIPLFSPPQYFVEDLSSSFEFDFIAATASKAFANDEKEVGIPEIFGIFDLNTLAIAMMKNGEKSPLRSDLLGRPLPFVTTGRIQAQGFTARYYQRITDYITLGCNLIFMRSNSRQTFVLNTQEVKNVTPGDIIDIDQARRESFEIIGLTKNDISQHGISDLDVYVRFGKAWDYVAKCRKVYAGLSLGMLAPTGVKTTLNCAASIPYGGNGHWGFYARGDSLFEVQEDKKIGFVLEAIVRTPKTVTTRMPIMASEPYIYGAIIGQSRISPAATIGFSPYFMLEHLRDGFGLGVHYTLESHGKDKWTDCRVDKSVPVDLTNAMKTSKWGADYFTIDIFYDFGKTKTKHVIDPVLTFRWDIPSMLFVSHLIPETHKISLGVMLAY
jgi:hypothetical protein